MQKEIFSKLQLNNAFLFITEEIKRQNTTEIIGLNDFSKCLALIKTGRPILHIVSDNLQLKTITQLYKDITTETVASIFERDEVLLLKNAYSRDFSFERNKEINKLLCDAKIVVTTINAVMQFFPTKIDSLKLEVGKSYVLDDVIKKLVELGYKRVESLEGAGTYSSVGDVINVFPISSSYPLRIDFFGDEIEDIKQIDVDSFKAISFYKEIEILQCSDVKIGLDEVDEILAILDKECKDTKDEKIKSRKKELRAEYENILRSNLASDRLDILFPLIKNKSTIFDLLDKDSIIVLDDVKRVEDSIGVITKNHEERFKSLFSCGETFEFCYDNLLKKEFLVEKVPCFTNVAFSGFLIKCDLYNVERVYNYSVSNPSPYYLSKNILFEDVRSWLKNNYNVVVFAENNAKCQNLKIELENNGLKSSIDSFDTPVTLLPYFLKSGGIFAQGKLAVIGSEDLSKRNSADKKLSLKSNALFSAPNVGDYVVHENYGIGKSLGIKRISTQEDTKDYMVLEYADGTLYIPLERISVLSKYVTSGKPPKLSKISTKEFEKQKSKVRAAVKELSFNLKALYKEREQKKGFVYPRDDELMAEFESRFAFETTEHQQKAIDAVKKDMESPKIMDRLICGDVGYGKTEVALRAAFKCISANKQVALLAPTTILSEQHYKTFTSRFKDFGVRVEVLNRFKSVKERNATLKRLLSGETEIVIGTHSLLSSEVKFKDLGLLILDEEQRFGVEHKEKIKNIKKNVDTLTLTATPIPRTLHMSLSGIRDISLINSPPKNRFPIQTYVMQQNDGIIKDAVMRELSRGGQVFILYNHVQTIYSFADKIKELIPEADIIVCHGQMDKKVLENSVYKFFDGEKNVMISTTIIETGIDIPNANTLIIMDSTKLGLSQMYQIRGRVGRSDRIAYAYFMYKGDTVTDKASDRLMAINQFTELNSGIKIAMRDLELRGAGNVLGGEQHGHLEVIGYELYSKILREEITGISEEEIDTDIRISAFISEKYIENNVSRMDAYKLISETKSVTELKNIIKNFKEVYGEFDEELDNLFIICFIKLLAKKCKFIKVSVIDGVGRMELSSLADVDEKMLNLAKELKFTLEASKNPALEYKSKVKGDKEKQNRVAFLKVFEFLRNCVKKEIKN